MKHKVIGVDSGSIAEEADIRPGDMLLSVDGEEVVDIVDYDQLTTKENLLMAFLTPEGELYEAEIEKDMYEPIGLQFESGMLGRVKNCKNHCMFCFIDQMPKPARSSLLLKDDDWRMSLFMGNYITLTNVGEDEFKRIIKRRASPLYISIHATDPDVRVRMMGNPSAGNLMGRLNILKESDLRFHGQIVLCPGVNDADILKRSLSDLMALYPSSQSVAVVPVGLTKHRLGLAELTVPGKDEASDTIDIIEEFQRQSLAKNGTSFVFASDEFYILAERELPPYESYEDFPQLENGVGLLRKFEHEFIEELKDHEPLPSSHRLDGATGFSAAPFLQKLFERLEPYGIHISLHPIRNDYLGDQITVAGLVTASDMIKQLKGGLSGEKLLIPGNMLRENEPVFLDNITLAELKKSLETDIIPMSPYDGGNFIESLFAMYEKGSADE